MERKKGFSFKAKSVEFNNRTGTGTQEMCVMMRLECGLICLQNIDIINGHLQPIGNIYLLFIHLG